jgi:ethanolamine kinase
MDHVIYHLFKGYEYFSGNTLNNNVLVNYSDKIAKNMAKFHKMEINIEKEPVFNRIKLWLSKVNFEKLEDFSKETFVKEYNFVHSKLKDTPINFQHNDLLGFNIVYNKEDDSVKFIDFEYSGYNYRS